MKERRRAREIVRTQEKAQPPRWEVRAEEERRKVNMKAETKVLPFENLPKDVQRRHRASLRAAGEKDE